ncbi:MAG: apolipoprotein N-acyltransferase [Desulfovibrionaceae bacterium CG1_02_65_16]|nr:MAG: apolipoprotein N-acyltransferase [Desulfovibrionaceae bacterium CG1_02_65_16]
MFGALLGYANPWVQFPPAALLLPLSVMLLGLAAPTTRQAFRYAWQAGSLASLACLYWVFWPIEHYGDVNWALALPVPVLLSMAMGCYYGLFGLAARASSRLATAPAALFLGLAWTAMELAQATLLSGFSWLTLSSAFVAWPITVQAVAYVGAYGLSGLLVAVLAGLVLCGRGKSSLIVSGLALAVILGIGWQRMSTYAETTPAHTVAVVQGNIDQSVKWEPQYQLATVQKYLRLSRQVADAASPELIIWPETSMPFYFQDAGPLRTPVLDFVREGDAALVLGSPAYQRTDGPRSFILFNRAFLLDKHNPAPLWYDKEHLVPFGEYMPLADILPLQKLVSGVGDFVPGQNERALKNGNLSLGVLVCYEAIFAGLAQDRVSQGANLLVNISNDAWFGDTSAPHQHLQLAALRAIEQGRYLVRSTNTGISAFIDPLGRITVAGPQFTELAVAGVVHPHAEFTVFHRIYGYLLPGFGGLAALFIVLLILGGSDSAKKLGQD